MSVLGDVETLPPLSSPQWCDHGPIVKTCSHCDPSETSGRLRAGEAREQVQRFKHIGILDIGRNLVTRTEELEEEK